MQDTIYYTFLTTLAGVIGTGIGGFLFILIGKRSNKFLSSMLEFSAGLMLAVIFLDLIPNALEKSNPLNVFLGIIIGIWFMNLTNSINFSHLNSYIQVGMVMAVGIAMHNIPEGLAMGAFFDVDFSAGISFMITILIHNIPEGLAFAIPLTMGGMKNWKILFIAIITGLSTGIGGFIGIILGNINDNFIASCLAIASGAMLFVVIHEMIPKSKTIYRGKISNWFNIMGIIIGIFIKCIV